MKKYLTILTLLFASLSAASYEFEGSTCTPKTSKSGDAATFISSVSIGKVINSSIESMASDGVWNQKTSSTEFVSVVVISSNGKISKSYYRVISGALFQSWPTADGKYVFKKIIIDTKAGSGQHEIVTISGSSLESTMLLSMSCEKNIYPQFLDLSK